MDLPKKFTKKGLLPVGDYEMSVDELLASRLVNGPNPMPIGWDVTWRRQLVHN